MVKDLLGRGGLRPEAGSGTPPSSLLSQHLGPEVAAAWEWAGAQCRQASALLSPPPPALETATGTATRPPRVFPRTPPVKMPAPVLAIVSGQVLPAFLLCSTLLIIKMYVVAVITGQVRLRKKVRAALGDPTLPRWYWGQSMSVQGWGQRCSLSAVRASSVALSSSRAHTFLSSVLRAFTHSRCHQVRSWHDETGPVPLSS